ncbi:hypothetical protein [Aristaeella hokkaidonensis]|uniref:Uncharacterized protein n=1 Tax=Aristaeella hokkaidonensis TaxID=3046382 RepID=A0AC61NMK8_9FIRM|nr:hypothetical protein [Aristaeella hokkaidonensis]QUC68198.1 hypothetical protein JYE49_05755 [Aristaeella hokkaidonensis]SNT95242.1 hypothetical protein SAMN06297421_11129 [Aristaeella hokkaidonensis]
MYNFKIKIAGRIIDVETLHTRPQAICRGYTTDGVADFKIVSTQSEIDKDKKVCETANHGKCDAWDGLAEEYTLLRLLADRFIDEGVLLYHGAAIALSGKGYIFSASSGTGKTTHINLWRKNKPETVVVNGDKPFILTGEVPYICGSPWAGKEGYNTNTIVPLNAVVFLERAERNSIREISFIEAFPYLYQQAYRPEPIEKVRKTLQMIQSLQGKVSFYEFKIDNFQDDCFQVAYDALGNGIKK